MVQKPKECCGISSTRTFHLNIGRYYKNVLPFIDVLNVRLKKASEVALDTHRGETNDKEANGQGA